MVRKELDILLSQNIFERKILTEEMITPLPAAVQKWLRRSNVVGQEIINTAHLHQCGQLRTSPNGKWMSFKADQYNTIQNPGFIWVARVKAAPLIHLTGRDKYVNGKGEMLIKLMSIVPVVHASGQTIDQGALVRFMAETIWFPSAMTAHYFSWEEIDSTQVKTTMHNGGTTASGTFTFNQEGDIKSFEAMRYYERKQGATLEKWHVDINPEGFKEYERIRTPAKATVTWKLKDADFNWLKLEITQMEYNKTRYEKRYADVRTDSYRTSSDH